MMHCPSYLVTAVEILRHQCYQLEEAVVVMTPAVERKMILPMLGPGALQIGLSFVSPELQILHMGLNLKTVLVGVVEVEVVQLFL
ncbi:unnamed protein product [Urochloa humidicola]